MAKKLPGKELNLSVFCVSFARTTVYTGTVRPLLHPRVSEDVFISCPCFGIILEIKIYSASEVSSSESSSSESSVSALSVPAMREAVTS